MVNAEAAEKANYLDVAGRLAALVALLLPATGFLVRYFAFSWSGVPGDAYSIAWSAPVSQLVTTGIVAMVPGLLTLPLVWLAMSGRRRELSHWKRRLSFLLTAAALVAILLTFPAPAVYVTPAIAGLVTGKYIAATREHPRDEWFRRLWPAVVVTLVAFALSTAAVGQVPGADRGRYHFAPAAGLPNGLYQQLGSTSGRVILVTCRPTRRRTLSVSDAQITLIQQGSAHWVPAPSIWQVLFDGEHFQIGLVPC